MIIRYLVKLTVNLIFSASLLCINSCSLNYGNYQDTEAAVPEFTFNNAVFTRYENGKASVSLESEKLEQYKSDGSSFAKKAVFTTYKSDSKEVSTKGSCDFLSIDTNNKLYILFDNISINLFTQNALIEGKTLRYNGKSQQVTSDADSEVKITRNDLVVSGNGFSASGINNSFTFNSASHGTIITDDNKNNSESDSIEQENNVQ